MKAESYLNLILNEFPFDVASTQPVEMEGLKTGTKIFKVYPEKSSLIPNDTYVGTPYIIDSISGTKIACHPHIVGRNLKNLCLESANEFIRVLLTLGLSDFDGSAVLNILRAGSGYMVVEALPKGVPVINIRTEYGGDGYRAHSARPLRVTYRDDLNKLPSIGDISTLLVPDTFATGGSAEEALKSFFVSGLEPKKIVIYGFTAIKALVRLGKFCSERDIELFSFSICNLTQLAYNNYDMPLYGFDESLYSSTGKLRRMGSIVDIQTLRRFFPKYVAGLDQPGDWSERQDKIHSGYGEERGDITGHLFKSIGLIESLMEINSSQPWYTGFQEKIAKIELKKLRASIKEYASHKDRAGE